MRGAHIRATVTSALLVCVLLWAGLGCASESEVTPAGVTVRDSADVAIVEHTEAAIEAAPQWILVDEPEVSIGEVEGDPAYLFTNLTGASRLASNTIVVADGTTGEIRSFDSAGNHRWTAGRIGSGPGEFQSIASMAIGRADSIFATDVRTAMLHVFSPDGEFVRSFSLTGSPTGSQRPFVIGILDSGAERRFFGASQDWNEAEPGTATRQQRSYLLYDDAGTPVTPVASMESTDVAASTTDSGSFISVLPFSRAAQAVAEGEWAVFGSSDTYEVHRLHLPTERRTIVRVDREVVPVTDEIRELWITTSLERLEETAGPLDPSVLIRQRERMSESPLPPSLPVYDELVGRKDGGFWVRSYKPVFEAGPQDWTVYGLDGQVEARIDVPEHLEVMDVGPDWLLAVATDELGVQRLVLHRIDTTGAPN